LSTGRLPLPMSEAAAARSRRRLAETVRRAAASHFQMDSARAAQCDGAFTTFGQSARSP
jgi:hypothetical protein